MSRYAYILFLIVVLSGGVWADGNSVGKVYAPYVEPLETELEFHYLDETLPSGISSQQFQLGIGHAIGEQWFAELIVTGVNGPNSSLSVEAYELELKTQLTEQGEYSADWGLLLELEKERNGIWEVAGKALISKELGRWSATVNAAAIYEWGSAIESELETELALQMRYRYKQQFEPALEYFKSEDTNAIGPVVSGLLRLGVAKKLRWETGLLFGLDDTGADKTLKASLEYEF